MKIEAIRKLLAQETVQLWSLQGSDAWKLAEGRGVLRADGRRAFAEFRPAYRWLIQQMNRRIPNYPDCYPVWAWAEKPDMRYKYHAPTGTPLIRIHFELPREQVLFSCFSSWHCVLNNDYLSKSEHAQQCFDSFTRRISAADLHSANMFRYRARKWVVNSWPRIFDFEWLAQNPEWHGEEIYLQATTAVIPLNSVISVESFIAR